MAQATKWDQKPEGTKQVGEPLDAELVKTLIRLGWPQEAVRRQLLWTSQSEKNAGRKYISHDGSFSTWADAPEAFAKVAMLKQAAIKKSQQEFLMSMGAPTTSEEA